ncbi:MAG: hypothetical protein HDR94_01780 [Bacteroides sp.]|nr:hypothetical protein [Bacteroides sp.]
MARRTSHNSNSRSRNRSAKKGGSSTSKIVIVALSLIALAGIGFGVWKLLAPTEDYKFSRKHLDTYIKLKSNIHPELLGDGAGVYVDMSDGMNFAYSSAESKAILQGVINKFANDRAINFYELSNSQISPLELGHTELYNYMLNPANYKKQKAPIEKTLEKILSANQPALLMTDFEEYKGGVIEQAAYAKRYFIDWLAKGYNITFYKWNFTENRKEKNMFLAVFDDNANRLNNLVATAVKLSNPNLATFVLGGREFAYPVSSLYPSLKEGGNYHNSKGQDVVTNVLSNGGAEDFISYSKPFASANGEAGKFAPLDNLYGALAEYYPIGVSWADAISNSKQMQQEGIASEDIFNHLLSNLYVDFGAQNGYNIEAIEVRTFDMHSTMKEIANNDSTYTEPNAPEVNVFLTADMKTPDGIPSGWKEITVDFDPKFNGTFTEGISGSDLMRANIVISKVSANINEAIGFFSWPGNMSLANSVKETLIAGSSNPQGRILYTYYLKTLAE